MLLKAYLEKHKLSQKEFAEQIGVTQGAVWQWLKGETKVRPSLFDKIEEATGGEVTRQDLRPDIFEVRAA
jgi:DNA-binding transcriptional regulator YdaS (Cro superfamily)